MTLSFGREGREDRGDSEAREGWQCREGGESNCVGEDSGGREGREDSEIREGEEGRVTREGREGGEWKNTREGNGGGEGREASEEREAREEMNGGRLVSFSSSLTVIKPSFLNSSFFLPPQPGCCQICTVFC